MYAKDRYDPIYRLLIIKQEEARLKHFKEPKAFIEFSSHINEFYEITELQNPGKKREVSILIVDVISSKKFHPVITEVFIRGRKLNISRIDDTIILSRTEGCKTKHYKLFHHEDYKQTRASTNCY